MMFGLAYVSRAKQPFDEAALVALADQAADLLAMAISERIGGTVIWLVLAAVLMAMSGMQPASDVQGRVDLRNTPLVTIDGARGEIWKE